MFNVGGAEVLVIALIALVVVGPEQLPSVLRKAGQQLAQLRSITTSVRKEFMDGVEQADPNNWVDEPTSSPTVMPSSTLTEHDPQVIADEMVGQMNDAERAAEERAMGAAAAKEQNARFAQRASTSGTKDPDPADIGAPDRDVPADSDALADSDAPADRDVPVDSDGSTDSDDSTGGDDLGEVTE